MQRQAVHVCERRKGCAAAGVAHGVSQKMAGHARGKMGTHPVRAAAMNPEPLRLYPGHARATGLAAAGLAAALPVRPRHLQLARVDEHCCALHFVVETSRITRSAGEQVYSPHGMRMSMSTATHHKVSMSIIVTFCSQNYSHYEQPRASS